MPDSNTAGPECRISSREYRHLGKFMVRVVGPAPKIERTWIEYGDRGRGWEKKSEIIQRVLVEVGEHPAFTGVGIRYPKNSLQGFRFVIWRDLLMPCDDSAIEDALRLWGIDARQ